MLMEVKAEIFYVTRRIINTISVYPPSFFVIFFLIFVQIEQCNDQPHIIYSVFVKFYIGVLLMIILY